MNINTKLLTLSLLISCIFGSAPLLAASVNWRLTFFNGSGQLAGNGHFSYNPETTTCIDLGSGGNCPPSPSSKDSIEVSTQIDSISIDLADLSWGEGSAREIGVAWWYDPAIDALPGWQLTNKGGTRVYENQWILRHGNDNGSDSYFGSVGDTVRPFIYEEALFFDSFTTFSQSIWTGTWHEYDNIEGNVKFHGGYGYIPDMNLSQGTFKAELINAEVPIPNALILFISSLFVLGFKRSKST